MVALMLTQECDGYAEEMVFGIELRLAETETG